MQGEKGRRLQRGRQGSPGHGPTSEPSLPPTPPQPTRAPPTGKCLLLSPQGVWARHWAKGEQELVPFFPQRRQLHSRDLEAPVAVAYDLDCVSAFLQTTAFRGTIMSALPSCWGPWLGSWLDYEIPELAVRCRAESTTLSEVLSHPL